MHIHRSHPLPTIQVWAVSLPRPVHHSAVESLGRKLKVQGGEVSSYVGAGIFLVSASRETLLGILDGEREPGVEPTAVAVVLS